MSFISGMQAPNEEINEKKRKRQEKRRARQRAEDEKNKAISENQNNRRQEEIDAINAKVSHLQLHVKEVAADGNCMFRAIAEQLAFTDPLMKSPTAYKVIRRKAADYLRDHEDDFKFFLEEDIDYETFCNKVEFSNGKLLVN